MEIIKIKGKADLLPDGIAYEYINECDITLVYCFNMSRTALDDILNQLLNGYQQVQRMPCSFHQIYKKQLYYQIEHDCINLTEGIPILKHISFTTPRFHIYLETKQRKRNVKDIIYFDTIDEIKRVLKEDYELQFVMPFFYTMREMKEYKKELKLKIKDLTLLYVLENRTLEGRKR